MRIILVLILTVCLFDSFCKGDYTITNKASRHLTSELLESSRLDYKQIHKLAINDQIRFHKPIIESHSTRIVQNLDGLYEFCLDAKGAGFSGAWFKLASLYETCPKANFHLMPVPSAFNDVTADNSVRNHMGWVWYKREIFIPISENDQTNPTSWLIHFESSNYMTIVWGSIADDGWNCDDNCTKLLASHVGGHLPFVANLSEILNVKSNQARLSARILLTIAVSNLLNEDTIPSGTMVNLSSVVGRDFVKFQPDFDFFHFSGLIGSVNLLKVPSLHWKLVNELSVNDPLMTQVDDRRNKGLVHFVACLSEPIRRSSIGQQTGEKLARVEARLLNVNIGDYFSIDCTPIVEDVRNNGSCFIISCPPECIQDSSSTMRKITLNLIVSSANNQEVDVYEHRVAPRKTRSLDPSKGLYDVELSSYSTNDPSLRGPMIIRGFGMHHEQMFSGRTMSLAAIMKDINLLRWSGANLIRTSHYPYSTAYLDACDQLGISVVAEVQAVGLRSFSGVKLALHKQLLLEMMQRDHSHPSIVAWSVANEPQSQLPGAKAYFEELLSYARTELHKYTKSKPLTAAIAQSHQVDTIGHTLDFIMVNHYFGWYDYPGVIEAIRKPLIDSLRGWAKLHPGKGLLISEFGADTIAGLHDFSPMSAIFSEEYQRDLVVEHEHIFNKLWRSNDATNNSSSDQIKFLGSMLWNFADFSTHSSLLRVGGNKKGVFNRDRSPKLAAHAIREEYLRNP